jgi:hypothetical protein
MLGFAMFPPGTIPAMTSAQTMDAVRPASLVVAASNGRHGDA